MDWLWYLLRRDSRNRTPASSPFSSMNSMPAALGLIRLTTLVHNNRAKISKSSLHKVGLWYLITFLWTGALD
jgi:hypothetical protein